MPDNKDHHTGLYEAAVSKITEKVKPHLHEVTQEFIDKSIDKYAPENPRYAKMIEFEVRRRGDGAGITQDVAEPLLWTGIKTGLALGIASAAHLFKKESKSKFIGYGAALVIMANNAVEWIRLVPRYKAGLQGSLEMAKDRWNAIEKTGIDPFSSQTREINTAPPKAINWQDRVSDLDVASGKNKSQHFIG